MPEHPWPADRSPMLAYLLERARAIVDTDGVEAALTWVAVHSWFEGALAEASLGEGR